MFCQVWLQKVRVNLLMCSMTHSVGHQWIHLDKEKFALDTSQEMGEGFMTIDVKIQ